jgi:murein DD-endopeptidase MepM/ murein hydrolase activator NlpD
MVLLRYVLGVSLLWVLVAPLGARGESPSALEPDAARDEFFSYPLRSGESLNDVARIFRVPAQELATINRITDPNRLQLGQIIRVPNGFARETAELRAERQQLLEQKSRADQDVQAQQHATAAIETQLRQVQSEKDSVAGELATMVRWRKTATGALALFLVALAWALKTLLERAKLARAHTFLEAENTALATAKEKYRQAAAQLELRYQNLYRGKGDPPKITVADGVSKLRAVFGEGSAEIERQLMQIRVEREKQKTLAQTEEKATLAWLPHPLRELLERRRLKYHMP